MGNWVSSEKTNRYLFCSSLTYSYFCSENNKTKSIGNIVITETGQLTIQGDIEMGGNGTLTVESGGKLIIDGGKLTNAKLDFKPGSTLRIINNGTIETRNGFTASVGVKVDISHGKIL